MRSKIVERILGEEIPPEDNKEYWQELNEEYAIPYEGDIIEWYAKDEKQRKYLLENYGESAWNIHHFMELCRAEKISESFFRQLCRYELDKNSKR